VTGARAVRLGEAAVRWLIPHRPPLLLVDEVSRLAAEPPALWAQRKISGDEAVLAGHFPGDPIWPGAYTMEGLGQTSLLLAVIRRLVAAHERAGGAADEVLDALAALGAGQLAAPPPLDRLGSGGPPSALAGQVEMKFLAAVRAGDTLEYHAVLTHEVGGLSRFEVTATVDRRPVARGVMTGALEGGARP
jgi:3-hydroxymyristoyl/3-hydroxydecanoyl-(acyl carrier protein) dehydratase